MGAGGVGRVGVGCAEIGAGGVGEPPNTGAGGLAGVGVGTASRVISGKGSFSQGAALRVETAAKQLGFRPSAIARALSLQSTGTIGIFVPDFKGPFYGPLLDAIDAELRAQDRHMVAANGCGDADSRQQSIDTVRFLIDRECDGIVICSNTLRDADFAIVGTGGMSHQLTGSNFGLMDEASDLEFLERLERDPQSLTALTHETMMQRFGVEGIELIMWLVMRGALSADARRVHRHYYAPMTTSMGLITFEDAR